MSQDSLGSRLPNAVALKVQESAEQLQGRTRDAVHKLGGGIRAGAGALDGRGKGCRSAFASGL